MRAVHGEEEGDFEPRSSLEGTPVVCCTLHSQLAPVCAGLGRGIRVAYVQIAGGALPVSLSDSGADTEGFWLAGSWRLPPAPALTGTLPASTSPPRSIGARGMRSTRSSARSGRGSWVRARRSATGLCPRPKPPTQRSLSVGGRFSLHGFRRSTRVDRHRGVSHHVRAGAAARARPGRRAPARRDRAGRGDRRIPRSSTSRAGRRPAQAFRSRRWVGARETTRGSSRPLSPPAGSPGSASRDAG